MSPTDHPLFWVRTTIAALAIVLASCGSTNPLTASTQPTDAAELETAPVVEQSPSSSVESTNSNPTNVGTTVPPILELAQNLPGRPIPAAVGAARQPLGPAPESGDVRDIDVRNDLLFVNHYGDGERFGPASNGEFTNGEWGTPDFFAFSVGEPVFADLDGDGSDEIVVNSAWSGGGSGYFSELRAFTIEGDHVVELAILFYGDRAHGGIGNVAAAPDGQAAIVDVFVGGDGACCPNRLQQQRVVIANERLVVVEDLGEITYVNLSNTDVPTIEFLTGTTRAMLALQAGAEETMHFVASQGDYLELANQSGSGVARARLTHVESGAQPHVFSGGIELADDGLFELTVVANDSPQLDETWSPTTVEMSIVASAEPLATQLPWVMSERLQTIRTDPAEITVFAEVPWFPNSPATSGAVAQFVDAQTDPWIEQARSTDVQGPNQGGEFELTSEVTLSTPRLVSVQFLYYEYLCCRPYPNHGNRAIVIEPDTGRVLADGEIIDLTRQTEVEEIFFRSLEISQSLTESDDVVALYGGFDGAPPWSSISVSPHGLTFGTDRQGAVPGVQTFVDFSTLGDLVMPKVLAAATA